MRTGPDFHEEHVLGDGTRVTLRHIRPEDGPELKRGFDQLSPTSRYRRFFGGVGSLSPELVRYLTCVDGQDHVAIVATTRPDGAAAERGVGVARFIRIPGEPTAAEAAITVIDDLQGKGLGHLLALTLARAAYERGVQHFRGQILADNAQVRELLDEVGAQVHEDEDGTVVFDVALDAPEVQGGGYDESARRLLRAASAYLVGVIRRLSPAPHR